MNYYDSLFNVLEYSQVMEKKAKQLQDLSSLTISSRPQKQSYLDLANQVVFRMERVLEIIKEDLNNIKND